MRLVVVGAGIAGLAAAHRAAELGRAADARLELVVLEARERPGGTIATERRDGFLLEAGPDSFLSDRPAGLGLCRRLGLERRVIGTDDRFRQVFVWRAGRLWPLPDGFQLLAPTRLGPFLRSGLFSWRGKARMALDVVLPRGGGQDESLASFVRRRLGREALERVAEPLVAGIYTADPETLSLGATMPRFLELERRHRSLILGLGRAARAARGPRGRRADGPQSGAGDRWSLFVSLAGGMGELVAALVAALPAGALRLGARALSIERAGGRWQVALAGGARIDADAVVIAAEAHAAARLVGGLDPALAGRLAAIPYASSATVSLGYARPQVAHALDGFGFVVPRAEGRRVLACTFSSVKYPGRAAEGDVLLRGFVGGALAGEMLALDDRTLVELVAAELAAALGVTGPARVTSVARHATAMPQYTTGHALRVAAVEQQAAALPAFALAGSAYHGVGIPDCIAGGEAAAERVLAAGGLCGAGTPRVP